MTREQEWEAALQQRAQQIASETRNGFEERARDAITASPAALRQLVRETYPHLNKSTRNAIARNACERLGMRS